MTAFWQLFIQFVAAAAAIGVLFAMRKLGQPPKRILIAASVMTAVIGIYGFQISVPHLMFADFIKGYYRGGREAVHGAAALEAVLGPAQHGFVNLPIMAYAFSPFSLLPADVAAYVWLALGVGTLIVVWRVLSQLAGLNEFGRATFMVLIGASGPTLYCLKEGNSGHIALLGLLAALLCVRGGKSFVAGALMGLAAATKLPLLLFGAYYFFRGRWMVVAGGASVLLGLCALSLLVFGWDYHVRWYESCIVPYSTNPLPVFNVQSLASFMARVEMGSYGIEDWRLHTLSPFFAFAAKASVAALMAAAVAVGVLARRREGPPVAGSTSEMVEYYTVLTLACVASPFAWSHYFVWLLAPVSLMLSGGVLAARARLLQGALWVAVALMVIVPVPLKFTGGLARKIYVVGVSDYLYAAIIVLGLLLWARLRPQAFSADAALPLAESDTPRATPAAV